MSARGVFFSLDKAQAKRLLKAEDDDEVMEQVEALEEAWEEEHLAECDKAWDALHRCLSDGTLDFEGGEYPLNRCVLGGRQLIGEEDYIAAFVTVEEVRDVAKALEPLTEAWLRERYEKQVPKDYSPNYGDEDFEYTWENFQDVRRFYAKAAREGRAVLFTVAE